MDKQSDEVVFEIKESGLSGTFDVLIDGNILVEMVDEDVAELLLDAAKGFHKKNIQLAAAETRVKALEAALEQVLENLRLYSYSDYLDNCERFGVKTS